MRNLLRIVIGIIVVLVLIRVFFTALKLGFLLLLLLFVLGAGNFLMRRR